MRPRDFGPVWAVVCAAVNWAVAWECKKHRWVLMDAPRAWWVMKEVRMAWTKCTAA